MKKGEEPNVFKTIESFVLNNDRTNTTGCFKVTMFSLSLIAQEFTKSDTYHFQVFKMTWIRTLRHAFAVIFKPEIKVSIHLYHAFLVDLFTNKFQPFALTNPLYGSIAI